MRTERPKGKCLTDDELACFVDGLAEPGLRRRVEDHLEHCNLCLHNVAELKRLVAPERLLGPALPARVRARAESIIADAIHGVPQFDVVLALKSGICRLLETTGDLVAAAGPAAVPVRGGKPSDRKAARGEGGEPGKDLRVAKSLSGHLVTLELAAQGEEVVPRVAIVEEASAARPDGIKAKIYSTGASETRYSRQGRIKFSGVKPGAYSIEIEEIGRIRLDIR